MRKVGWIVLIFVVFVGFKLWNWRSDSADVLADMKEVIARLDVNEADAEYLEGLLEREHTIAFEAAYDTGSRRRGATFDEDKYLVQVLDAMIKQCDRDRETEIAAKLRALKQAVESSIESTGE